MTSGPAAVADRAAKELVGSSEFTPTLGAAAVLTISERASRVAAKHASQTEMLRECPNRMFWAGAERLPFGGIKMEPHNQEFASLIERLGHRESLPEAWRELGAAGQAAVPAAREGLSHPNAKVRQFCAAFIDAHWDESALRRLILTLHDPKLKVRKAAVHSLGCDRCKGGENPIDVLPYVEERIREDKSIKVRRTAVWTLAAQTPNKRIARVLRRALRDETDPKMRMAANWGIGRYEQSRRETSDATDG
jgi:hypothetical protein